MCKFIHILERSVDLLPRLLSAYDRIDDKFDPVITNRKQLLRILTTNLCFARVLLYVFWISPERFLISKLRCLVPPLDDTRNIIITHLLESHISYLSLYIFQDIFLDCKISNAMEIMCRLSSCAISRWLTPWVASRLVKIPPVDLGTTRGPKYFVCCHGMAPLTRA